MPIYSVREFPNAIGMGCSASDQKVRLKKKGNRAFIVKWNRWICLPIALSVFPALANTLWTRMGASMVSILLNVHDPTYFIVQAGEREVTLKMQKLTSCMRLLCPLWAAADVSNEWAREPKLKKEMRTWSSALADLTKDPARYYGNVIASMQKCLLQIVDH